MNAPTTDPKLSRASRAFLVIIGIVVLLSILLAGAWFYLADRLDDEVGRAIDRAAERGTQIQCEDRDVFGFPFRVGLLCESTAVVSDGGETRVTAGGLRTAAQIYRPNHVVAELDGPMRVETRDAPALSADWSLLSASATFWTEGVQRFALQAVNPTLARVGTNGGEGAALGEANDLEIHGRRREGDLDLAASTFGTRLTAPDAPDVSPFALRFNATIDDAADWLDAGGPPDDLPDALVGRHGSLRTASLEFQSSAALGLSGDYRFDDEGRLSGQFALSLTRADRLAEVIGTLAPDFASIANAVAQAVGFAGRPDGDARVLDLSVDAGRLSVGMIPLGTIPPVTEWQG